MALAAPGVPAAAEVNRLEGVVRGSVFVGDRLEIIVETGAGRVTAEAPSGGVTVGEGDAVSLLWKPEDTLVFPRPAA